MTRFDGVDVIEAARRLDPMSGFRAERRQPVSVPKPAPPRVFAYDDPDWQATVDALVVESEANLWSARGRDARAWLAARGLSEVTARRFRLGFIPDRFNSEPLPVLLVDDQVKSISLPRGIVQPWPLPDADISSDNPTRWAGVNVRRLARDVFSPLEKGAKCKAAEGSTRGFGYPWAEILPTQGALPALIVEGEFDAMLAAQEVGHLVHVMTIGGAGTQPHPTALAALGQCPWWLIATDHDGPGIEAALGWIERAPHKARPLLLPIGKDLTDFVVAGGDMRTWLAEELKRLKITNRNGSNVGGTS